MANRLTSSVWPTRIKESAVEAIRVLHAEGIRVVMLTGDNRMTADAVPKAVGIDQVEADVFPDRKATVEI